MWHVYRQKGGVTAFFLFEDRGEGEGMDLIFARAGVSFWLYTINVFQRLLTVSQNINATFITQKIRALKGSRHLLLKIVLNLGKAN